MRHPSPVGTLFVVPRPPPVVSIDSGGHRDRVLARRDELVKENLSLVPPIARRIALALPPCFDVDDLVAVGNLALIHAATRYRPLEHGGAPFSAFARPRIKGEILNSVTRRNWEESTRPPIDDAPEPIEPACIEIDTDRRLLRERVAEAIGRLPAHQKAVIAAYYAETLPRARERLTRKFLPGSDHLVTVGSALGLPEWEVIRQHADAIAELRRRLKAAS